MKCDFKYKISIDASDLKLIRHPKREFKIQASKIKESSYSNVFPKTPKEDILYVSLVAYTIGHINKNKCLILPEEGIATYKTAIEKPLDIEHARRDIVGFCVNSFLSTLDNAKIISEEASQEILANNGMVNVGNVFAVWKINASEAAELLEENFDEQSENFNCVKASFEYYFNDYKIFKSNGMADFPDGEFVEPDSEEWKKLDEVLVIHDGNGIYEGNKISVCPINGFVGGVALTLNPANEYSDLTAAKDGEKLVVATDESHNISQESVIKNTGDLPMAEVKKENVAEASVQITVDKTVADELQKQLDSKIKELGERDGNVQKLSESVASLQKDLAESQAAAKKAAELATQIQQALDKEIEARKVLEAKEIERTRKELVASRLSKVSEYVEITDNNRALLEKECADSSEEDFVKKLEFYKSISKKVAASEATTTSADVKTAVKEVVAETAGDTKGVNIIAAPSDSLIDRFSKAFTAENFGFSDKK